LLINKDQNHKEIIMPQTTHTAEIANPAVASHAVVSEQEWLSARKKLLQKEKEFTRQRDEISRLRRELPWVKVKNNYVFDGPNGKETLADLFGSKSQLNLSLHAWPGLGRRLPELFHARRSSGRKPGAPCQP
jgi:hypothetical protein